MTKGELNQKMFDLAIKFSSIALVLDDASYDRIKEPLKAIERGIVELCKLIPVEDEETDH